MTTPPSTPDSDDGAPPNPIDGEPDEYEAGIARQRIGNAAVKSLVWSALSFGFTRIAVLVTTLLLARLLVPEAFGVFAAGLTVIGYLEIALDLGIGAALIYDQEKGITPRLHTAFTLNLGICVILTILGWFTAPWIAAFFHTPGQEAIYRALFLFLILRGLCQIHDSILKRDLQFRRRAAVDVTRGVLRAGVSIPLALAGFGAWSIVIGFLASEFGALVVNWIIVSYRPRLRLDRSAASSLLRFGLAVTALKVFAEIGTNSDYLVVGNRLGPTQLGYYSIAFRIPEMLISSAYWVFSSVAFPVYSQTRDAGMDALRATMLRVLRLATLFGFSVGVGLAIAARDIVYVVLGQDWAAAAVPLAILSLAMGLQATGYASGDIFPALGRPGFLLAINTPLTFILLGGFIVASYYGLAAVAAVHLAFSVIYGLIRVVFANRLTQTPMVQSWSAIRPALSVTAGIVAFALPIRLLFDTGFASLVAITVAGISGGVVGLLIGGRSVLPELRALVANARARS